MTTAIQTKVSVQKVSKEQKKTRRTFGEAIEKVLDESKLRKISLSEEGDWIEAFNYDINKAHQIVDKLAEDLTRITGKRVVRKSKLELKTAYQTFRNNKDRVAAIWDEFKIKFPQWVKECVGKLKAIDQETYNHQTYAYTFPLQVLPATVSEPKHDVIKFNFTDEFGWQAGEFALASFSLKSPDDFTRNIPKRAKKKLEILKTTHYDYNPKILDGALLYKREIVPPLARDPGLALNLGENYASLLCDFWSEPSQDTFKNRLIVKAQRFFTHFLVVYTIAIWVALAFILTAVFTWDVPYSLFWNIPAILGTGFALLLEACFLGMTKEAGRDEFLPECRKYIPKRKLVL